LNEATASAPKPQSWLIRTSTHRILGPVAYDRLCEMIRGGEITLQDEICPANSYWFYLHERAEVARWVGVELPKPVKPKRTRRADHSEDEDTETTDIFSVPAATSSGESAALSHPHLAEGGHGPGVETGADSTRVLMRPQAASQSLSAPAPVTAPMAAPLSTPVDRIEKSMDGAVAPALDRPVGSFFKNFGWLLIAGSALVVYVVLRMTRLQ